jgi:iron complex transport system permease protein
LNARATLSLGLLTAGLFALSLLTARGLSSFDPGWWAALAERPDVAATIFLEIRLPRALLALLAGAGLGMTGAALQGLLRNPLADPGLIGTSGGAAMGAVAVFYSGIAGLSVYVLPLGGMAGAGLALLLLILIAGWRASTLTLILAGIAVSALMGALMSLALNLSPNPNAAFEIIAWTLGSLTDRSFDHVAVAGPPILLGMGMLWWLRPALDALTLGEETAASLGTDVARARRLAIMGTTLTVGAATAVTGIIGFIGLVAPHLVRRFAQGPGGTLIPAALAGAALLLAADILVRIITIGPELKLGVLTALAGAPFLLFLVARTAKDGA